MQLYAQSEKTNVSQVDSAMILVANDVWSADLAHHRTALEEAGACIQIIGNRSDLICDSKGWPVQTDNYLGQLKEQDLPDVLVIPNGQNCVLALLVDPRVHRLVTRVIAADGHIRTTPIAELLMRRVGLLTTQNRAHFITVM